MNVNEIMHARVPCLVSSEFPHIDHDLVEQIDYEGQLHALRHPCTVICQTDNGEVTAQGFASIELARKDLEEHIHSTLSEGWEPTQVIDNVLKKTYNIRAKAIVSFVEVKP